VTEQTYDDLRRLVSIATTGLSANDIIAKFTYEYNDLGLRDKVTAADGRTTEWAYDDGNASRCLDEASLRRVSRQGGGRLIEEHFKKPDATALLGYMRSQRARD
jgi:hypothetical protein